MLRGVAQVVAHLTGGQGVASSSLVTPTKEKDSLGCPFLWSKTRQGCGGGYLYRRREEKHME